MQPPGMQGHARRTLQDANAQALSSDGRRKASRVHRTSCSSAPARKHCNYPSVCGPYVQLCYKGAQAGVRAWKATPQVGSCAGGHHIPPGHPNFRLRLLVPRLGPIRRPPDRIRVIPCRRVRCWRSNRSFGGRRSWGRGLRVRKRTRSDSGAKIAPRTPCIRNSLVLGFVLRTYDDGGEAVDVRFVHDVHGVIDRERGHDFEEHLDDVLLDIDVVVVQEHLRRSASVGSDWIRSGWDKASRIAAPGTAAASCAACSPASPRRASETPCRACRARPLLGRSPVARRSAASRAIATRVMARPDPTGARAPRARWAQREGIQPRASSSSPRRSLSPPEDVPARSFIRFNSR